jgi:tetratricopeptide (TPR) repeat protein
MSELWVEAGANPDAEQAEVLIGLKRYKEALNVCSRAIASDPEDASNYATLTRIHLLLNQNQEALKAARSVISLEPEWSYGYYLISICLHNSLDFDGELRAAQHALSLAPEDPALLDRLARAQIQSGQLKHAKSTATQLVHISPESADTFSLLSDICFELNDYKNAETHLLSALCLTPEEHILHNDMGRIHLVRKEFKKAIDAFFNAAKLHPAEKLYQDNMNLAISYWLDKQLLAGKRKSHAIEELEPAIRAFYKDKLARRTAFERLGMFGPLLLALSLLVLMTLLFNALI